MSIPLPLAFAVIVLLGWPAAQLASMLLFKRSLPVIVMNWVYFTLMHYTYQRILRERTQAETSTRLVRSLLPRAEVAALFLAALLIADRYTPSLFDGAINALTLPVLLYIAYDFLVTQPRKEMLGEYESHLNDDRHNESDS